MAALPGAVGLLRRLLQDYEQPRNIPTPGQMFQADVWSMKGIYVDPYTLPGDCSFYWGEPAPRVASQFLQALDAVPLPSVVS